MRVSWLCVRVHVPGGHARRLGKLLLHALALRQPPRPRHLRPRRVGLVRCPAPAPRRRAPRRRGGLVRRPAPAPLRRAVGSVRPLAVPVVEGQLRGEIGPNGDQRPMRAGGRQSIPDWCEEVAILLSQLAHGPTDMHAGTSGEAGVVDTRHEIWHMVHVRRGGFGDLGECGNEVLRGDRRGSCQELAGMLPPIGCARVGPPGIERCGRQVGSCCVQKRDVEPGVSGVSDFTGRRTPR